MSVDDPALDATGANQVEVYGLADISMKAATIDWSKPYNIDSDPSPIKGFNLNEGDEMYAFLIWSIQASPTSTDGPTYGAKAAEDKLEFTLPFAPIASEPA